MNDTPLRPPDTEKVLAHGWNRLVGTSEEVPCKVIRRLMGYCEFPPHPGPRQSQGDCSKNAQRGKHNLLACPLAPQGPGLLFGASAGPCAKQKKASRLTLKVSNDTYRATNLNQSSARIRRPHRRRKQAGVWIALPQWSPHHTVSLPPAASWIIKIQCGGSSWVQRALQRRRTLRGTSRVHE